MSLLPFPQRLQDAEHRNNLKTLFAVNEIPKNSQLREVVDSVDSDIFAPIFKVFYQRLQRRKHLAQYQLFPGQYYFPIDGSQFYHSKEISCGQFLTKAHRDGTTSYSHQVLQGRIMLGRSRIFIVKKSLFRGDWCNTFSEKKPTNGGALLMVSSFLNQI